MIRSRRVQAALCRLTAPAALLLLAACAAGGRARAGAVEVEVRNDMLPRADLTVRVVSDGGFRQLLGGVAPGATRTLRFQEPLYTGRYRLVGQRADGTEVTSLPFSLFAGARVTWTVRENRLSVGRSGSTPAARSDA
jgi:hypothetical protein